MHYLYKITDTLNDKIYIGQTIDNDRRWKRHKYSSKQENPVQYISRAIKKHGEENFIYEIIATCKTSKDADETEKILIIQYDSRNKEKGYNLAPGGNYIMLGRHHSEETKKKISIAHKGIKLSEEHKNNLSLAHTGYKMPDDQKENISKSKIGKLKSKETRKKMSQYQSNRPKISEETKKKKAEAMKGKTWKLIDGKRVWSNKLPKDIP